MIGTSSINCIVIFIGGIYEKIGPKLPVFLILILGELPTLRVPNIGAFIHDPSFRHGSS